MTNLSLTGTRWVESPANDADSVILGERGGLSPIASRCLAVRWGRDGIDPLGLKPSFDQLHSPDLMMGMAAAVDRLQRAVRDREHVRIITDYDVDGTTSSLILQAVLKMLAPDLHISYHIPNRFGEGYGFSVLAAQTAVADKVDLIVTADIGVRDHLAVQAAKNGGVDVLICDHHLPAGASVPEDALVLCPPQKGDAYPNRSLAACGVSLKLAQALLKDHGKKDIVLKSLLKLAAIGTVADLVPLTTPENRAIVGLGLRELNGPSHHPGLRELLRVADLTAGSIDERDLGFRIGPRINAAGRVADASLVIRLLTTRDEATARALADELNELNSHRRDIQKKVEQEALERLEGNTDPFVVISGSESEGWHRGVVGIVASRLKDELNRPVAVVSIQGDQAVGSVRSTPGVHAVRALDEAKDLLVKYGGHPAAAGFTVPTSRLAELGERLTAYAKSQGQGHDAVPERLYDAELTAQELDWNLQEQLGRLAPFGMGNPEPRLVVRQVKPLNVSVIGQSGTTMKFLIPRKPVAIDAIWFRHAEHAEWLRSHAVDVLGKLTVNAWQGRSKLQFEVEDIREAQPPGELL